VRRTVLATGFIIGLLAIADSDLSACGDKSLSAGGIRMQRALAARYPASILIYAPPNSRLIGAAHEMRLQEHLRLVGHRYREVATDSDLETSVATGQFNIVLADLADAPALQQRFASSPARVVVVPVAYKLTKEQTAQAAKLTRFLIKAPEYAANYLMTIADAVHSRSQSPRKA